MENLLEGMSMLLDRGGPVMIPLLILSVCSIADHRADCLLVIPQQSQWWSQNLQTQRDAAVW